MTRWPAIRDVLLFFGGMAFMAHEVVIEEGTRSELLIAILAMMGVPFFLNKDKE